MKVELRIRARHALLSSTLLCCVPFAPAHAQDALPDQASAESVDDENVITVTGSRLVRPDLSAPWKDLSYLTNVVFTTGILEEEDHFIVASGEDDLVCRISRIPKSRFGL